MRLAFLALLSSLLVCSIASGQSLKYRFEATVDSIYGWGPARTEFFTPEVGDTLTGTFEFDSSVEDSSDFEPEESYGEYFWSDTSELWIEHMELGDMFQFRTATDKELYIENFPEYDAIGFEVISNFNSDGLTIGPDGVEINGRFSLFVDDLDASAFEDDSIPERMMLEDFASTAGVDGRFIRVTFSAPWGYSTCTAKITVMRPLFQKGDANGDFQVDFGDLSPFITAILEPEVYDELYPDVDRIATLDFNDDNKVDFGDISGFIAAVLS